MLFHLIGFLCLEIFYDNFKWSLIIAPCFLVEYSNIIYFFSYRYASVSHYPPFHHDYFFWSYMIEQLEL